MKSLLSVICAMMVLSGCGEPDHGDLNQGPGNLGQENGADLFMGSVTSVCNGPIVASLIQTESGSYSPTIRFVSTNKTPVTYNALSAGATTNQRCTEIEHHFSGAPIKEGPKTIPNEFSLEIEFSTTGEQEKQMLSGKAINVRPETAHFAFTDGSLNSTSADLEIRCPGMASVTCQITEIGDYKKCESYDVNFSDQCSFRGKLLFFSFSDHKKASLDAMGELQISTGNGSQMKFTKVSWMGLD